VPISKIDVVFFSLIPFLETGTYEQASFCFIARWDVPGAPSSPWKNHMIFRGGSAHYGPKSVGGSEGLLWRLPGRKSEAINYQWNSSVFGA
jgi:hypothetical protein